MRHDSFPGRLGTVLSLSVGYLCLHFLGILLLSVVVQPFFRISADQLPPTLIVSDGRPLLRMPWQSTRSWSFKTLDNETVEMRKRQAFSTGAFMQLPQYEQRDLGDNRLIPWTMTFFGANQDNTSAWYFVREWVQDRLTGYFVVYSNQTLEVVAYIGVNGESATMPPPDQRFELVDKGAGVFSDSGSPLSLNLGPATVLNTGSTLGNVVNEYVLLVTRSGLKHVHLKSRRIETVLAAEDLCSATMEMYWEVDSGSMSQKTEGTRYKLLIRSTDTIYYFENERLTAKYRVPDELRSRPFTVFPVDSKTVFYGASLNGESRVVYYSTHILKCDADGAVLEQQEVPHRALNTNIGVLESLSIAGVLPIPLQLLATLGLLGTPPLFDPGTMWRDAWPSIILLACFGLISGFIAARLTFRWRRTRIHWGWLVYTAILGLPGLIGYLLHFRHRYHPPVDPAPQSGTEIFG
jgi:hypothetical protein